MQVTTIGLDIAKRVFQVHGIDCEGAIVVRRKLKRSELLHFFNRLTPCLVGIEACATAHHWARELMALGQPGPAAAAKLHQGLPQARQERCRRCGSDLRGSDAADHALRVGEEHGAAERARLASWARIARSAAHDAGQWAARSHGGVRHHCATRDPAGARARGDAERRDDRHSADCARCARGARRTDQQSYDEHQPDGESASLRGAVPIRRRAGWRPFPALARSLPRHWLPRSRTQRCSDPAGTLRRGSAWCRASIRPAARPDSVGSRKWATNIYASCWSWA